MSELSVKFDATDTPAKPAETLVPNVALGECAARDHELIRRLSEGDETAMRLLIETHGEMLGRLVGRLTGWCSDRDDILQDVLLTVWQQAASFRGNGSLEGWLRTIAVNRCRNYFRTTNSLRRMIERFASFTRPQTVDPPSTAEDGETKKQLQHVLQKLSQSERTVLVLFYLEEMPGEQIADLLNVKPETLHVRLHRARQKLKSLIENDREKFI